MDAKYTKTLKLGGKNTKTKFGLLRCFLPLGLALDRLYFIT